MRDDRTCSGEFDLVAVDRRTDVRVIVNVPGQYSLASKRDSTGERRVFACKAVNISTGGLALLAPVIGPLGDRVAVTLDHFGRLPGTIIRHLSRGFVMSIAGSDEERDRLMSRLIWFEQHRHHDVADGRKHGRIVPRNPYSTLILPDGGTMTCLVIDMSASGAGVSADIVPKIGTVLAVVRVVGRVVRRFAEGFAIEFIKLEDLQTLERRLIAR
jgi:hypothetical protein